MIQIRNFCTKIPRIKKTLKSNPKRKANANKKAILIVKERKARAPILFNAQSNAALRKLL